MKPKQRRLVIQYKDKLVGGFSLKHGVVYCYRKPTKAKTFTSKEAGEFLAAHGNVPGHNFDLAHVRLHFIEPGKLFTLEDCHE